MPHPVTAYHDDIRASLGVGVAESSGYPALRNSLHAVGDSLKPKISPVIHPATPQVIVKYMVEVDPENRATG